MKIIVIGSVKFSLEMLITLYEINAELVGVITGLDTGFNADYEDLEPFCREKQIPCIKTNKINEQETVDWVMARKADVIFCLGWSRLIKSEILQSTPLGVIGYHPAALPKNRGRHPLIWALVLGLKETASSFFFMDEGADSGDILSQEIMSILPEDDAKTLYSKMISTAKKQIETFLPELENQTFKRVRQNHQLANTWRKRGKKDGEIDWRMSAESIYNLIRALTHPYVGSHFIFDGEEYQVWKSRIVHIEGGCENIEPGKVLQVQDNSVIVKCGKGCIELLEITPFPPLSYGVYL
ncbi:MAG: formyl transferase [Desulfamplus sp.]|nr:formyl transferase [Desulfamplus sp.]